MERGTSLEYALANRRLADRFFATVTKMLQDGGVMLRRMDGRGEVLLPSGEASSIGVELRIGTRVEFEMKDGVARDACTIEAGQRRLAVSS